VLATDLAHAFGRERHARHRAFPEVHGELELLQSEYVLGLLTNGASEIQREKIARSGLERFFASIVISGEAGVGKPNRAIFELALSQLRAQPDSAVMVGDNLGRDVRGAKDARIAAVWVNRFGLVRPSESVAPDVEVTDLRDFRAVLARLGR
jgi:putative hydrolase of the HAD superfamily